MEKSGRQQKSENSKAIAHTSSKKKSTPKSTFQFVDNRPGTLAQRKRQEMVNNSSPVQKQENWQAMANSHAGNPIQKQPKTQATSGENNTGLPDTLKTGMENLSGISLDDVKVHRNSDKPAQLQAHAYAQGTDIHLGPGQEKHLPHEAWHVVQQKQGRVKPTVQMKGKVNINDDTGLEKEADVMGAKAIQKSAINNIFTPTKLSINNSSIQRKEIGELVSAIGEVMDEGKLKKEQIIDGLKKLPKTDIDDPNFPRSLVEFVKTRNEITDFSIQDLDETPDPKFGKKHLTKKWTFRHYTNEKHESLQSLAALEANDINASANTNNRDWEELGNQGYVFGLICVDGKVPKRTWLSKVKYYAEYDLKDLPSIWVSGDMLDKDGRSMPSYQGSGTDIIAMLSKMLGFISQNEETAIDEKFAGKLEAKIPPSALGKPDWKDA